MATNSCTRCPVLEAEIDELRQEIKLLKRRIEYLKRVMEAVLSILNGLLNLVERILQASGRIIGQPSGVPPMTWQRHKGRHEVAKKFEGSLLAAIQLLEKALE